MIDADVCVDHPGDIEVEVCDEGHGLYVTRRTKQLDPDCDICGDPIPYRAQSITCAGDCRVSYCLKCSGCVNAHVTHRRFLDDAELEPRKQNCLRCTRYLGKNDEVKWCLDCNHAYCPDRCSEEKVGNGRVD